MKKGEYIYDYVNRFDKVVNGMKNLRKTYSYVELNKKLLRCLTNDWMAMKIVIIESKDLNIIYLDNIIDSLLTHEIDVVRSKSFVKNVKMSFFLNALKFDIIKMRLHYWLKG